MVYIYISKVVFVILIINWQFMLIYYLAKMNDNLFYGSLDLNETRHESENCFFQFLA